MGAGEDFQEGTKYIRGKLPGGGPDRKNRPDIYKTYAGELIKLPAPKEAGGDLWRTVANRRSKRSYADGPIELSDLSQILWASQGITKEQTGYGFRAAPSAGALYPVETYLVINNAAGAPPGIYHYNVQEHALETLRQGDFKKAVSAAALDQDSAYKAGVVFIWTAIIERCRWKYKQRAFRYIYLDAGHIAHAVALSAVALGHGTCQIAAFYDEEVNELVGADGVDEAAIYMTSLGAL